jgi:hypothetical protein
MAQSVTAAIRSTVIRATVLNVGFLCDFHMTLQSLEPIVP